MARPEIWGDLYIPEREDARGGVLWLQGSLSCHEGIPGSIPL